MLELHRDIGYPGYAENSVYILFIVSTSSQLTNV